MNDANYGRRLAVTLVAALGTNGLVTACGASTRLVPAGPHPPHLQEFVTVAFPPPPAEIEELP
ncbi:MAG TPA: hypothetical protein VGQ57_17875, partial [Polyangiaceae bacterium]|nr:hypothetical protein [Polyangiaceae bacterium]